MRSPTSTGWVDGGTARWSVTTIRTRGSATWIATASRRCHLPRQPQRPADALRPDGLVGQRHPRPEGRGSSRGRAADVQPLAATSCARRRRARRALDRRLRHLARCGPRCPTRSDGLMLPLGRRLDRRGGDERGDERRQRREATGWPSVVGMPYDDFIEWSSSPPRSRACDSTRQEAANKLFYHDCTRGTDQRLGVGTPHAAAARPDPGTFRAAPVLVVGDPP